MSLPVTTVARGLTPLPRFVARVTGDKALAFLHDTTSQELAGLEPGRGALTCVLDDKGRIEAEVRALVIAPGEVLLDGEEAGRDAVFGRLARIAPLSGVTIEDAGLPVTAARGLDLDAPDDEHAWRRDGEAILVRTRWGGDGIDVIGTAAVDGEEVPFEAFEAARIAAGRPRFGVDIAPGTLINETPLIEHAVSFVKGCYPGQESVARVRNLGRIRRRLVLVSLAGAVQTPLALTHGDAAAGTLTSAAGGAGIATVDASLEPGARLDAGGTAATLERPL